MTNDSTPSGSGAAAALQGRVPNEGARITGSKHLDDHSGPGPEIMAASSFEGETVVNRAFGVATELLRRGVQSAPQGGRSWETLALTLARASARFNIVDDCPKYAEQVLAFTSVPDRAAEMRDLLASLLIQRAQPEAAFTIINEGLGGADLSPRWRARLQARRVSLFLHLGDLDGADASARSRVR